MDTEEAVEKSVFLAYGTLVYNILHWLLLRVSYVCGILFLFFTNERKGAKYRFLLLWDIISIQKRSD